MRFYHDANFYENQLKYFKLHLVNTATYSPTQGEGNLVYDTTSDALKYWVVDSSNPNGHWVELMTAGSSSGTYTNEFSTNLSVNGHWGATLTLSGPSTNSPVNILGTDNEVKVKFQAVDEIHVGLEQNVIIQGNLNTNGNVVLGNQASDTVTITGDLLVSGTTTTVNSNVLDIADNNITLNSDLTGTPPNQVDGGGITVNRGTSADVGIRYNEVTNAWQYTNDGSTWCYLPCLTDPPTGPLHYFDKVWCQRMWPSSSTSGPVPSDGSAIGPNGRIAFLATAKINAEVLGYNINLSGLGATAGEVAQASVAFVHKDPVVGAGSFQSTWDTNTYLTPTPQNASPGFHQLANGEYFDVVESLLFDSTGHRTEMKYKRLRLPTSTGGGTTSLPTWGRANVFNTYDGNGPTSPGVAQIGTTAVAQTAQPGQSYMSFIAADGSMGLSRGGASSSANPNPFYFAAQTRMVSCVIKPADWSNNFDLPNVVGQLPKIMIKHNLNSYHLTIDVWKTATNSPQDTTPYLKFAGRPFTYYQAEVNNTNAAGQSAVPYINSVVSSASSNIISVAAHSQLIGVSNPYGAFNLVFIITAINPTVPSDHQRSIQF